MYRHALTVLALGLWLALPAFGDDDAVKKELEKFQGTWTTQSAELDGTSIGDLTKDLKFSIKGDVITIEGSEEVLKQFSKGTIKVDPSVKPKAFDFTVGGGDKKGDVIEAIYEFNKDELKVCAKLVGKERPTEFVSKENSGTILIVVKKEKK
jgi:uncharacterized protein (TIGR03067 family)